MEEKEEKVGSNPKSRVTFFLGTHGPSKRFVHSQYFMSYICMYSVHFLSLWSFSRRRRRRPTSAMGPGSDYQNVRILALTAYTGVLRFAKCCRHACHARQPSTGCFGRQCDLLPRIEPGVSSRCPMARTESDHNSSRSQVFHQSGIVPT